MRHLLASALVLAIPVAHGADPKPLTAHYVVLRDGKPAGDATYSVIANDDGTWTLRIETKGSAGMAKLLGLDVQEESTFRWQGGHAQGIHYRYKQSASIKHKERTIDFDTAAHRAHVDDNGKNFSYETPPNTIDRSTVALVLGLTLADGAHETTLPVGVRDHVEQQHYEARGNEAIDVPAGHFQATRIERTDLPGKATSWYAPTVSALPLRMEQAQGDGSKIVIELKQR
ncbi:MAG TPA: DUF6134 family protein [Rudaea sp.]